MTLAELRDRFRLEEFDTTLPYLWSDVELNTWINEAQDEACRRALLLVDSKSRAAKVAFPAGATGITLHPSVIFIRRATLASNNIPLQPRVSRYMDEEVPGWEGSMPSKVRVFVPDWQTGYLRFWPPSVAADTVNMTVVRAPMAPAEDGDQMEIPLRYQPFLLDWVRFRAYRKQDAEVFNADKSKQSEASFVAQFGPASAVNEHWALEQYYDLGHN